MASRVVPAWAAAIRKGLERTEQVFRQGIAQAMAGFTKTANPFNHDERLAPIWTRGFEQETERINSMLARWKAEDRGSR